MHCDLGWDLGANFCKIVWMTIHWLQGTPSKVYKGNHVKCTMATMKAGIKHLGIVLYVCTGIPIITCLHDVAMHKPAYMSSVFGSRYPGKRVCRWGGSAIPLNTLILTIPLNDTSNVLMKSNLRFSTNPT